MAGSGFNGMTIIALVLLAWLLIFLIGLVCCIYDLKKRRPLVPGGVMVILSLPALWFLRFFWPFDFLLPSKSRILSTAEHSGWKVTLMQSPSHDLYHTGFQVISPDGRTNWFTYNIDEHKWWQAESKIVSNRMYFFRGSAGTDKSPSYLDLERKVFWCGYSRQEKQLTAAEQQE